MLRWKFWYRSFVFRNPHFPVPHFKWDLLKYPVSHQFLLVLNNVHFYISRDFTKTYINELLSRIGDCAPYFLPTTTKKLYIYVPVVYGYLVADAVYLYFFFLFWKATKRFEYYFLHKPILLACTHAVSLWSTNAFIRNIPRTLELRHEFPYARAVHHLAEHMIRRPGKYLLFASSRVRIFTYIFLI